MSHAVNLSELLVSEAREHAAINHRSLAKQIEYWSRIGKIAEDNPDLPYGFIKEVMLAKSEADKGKLDEYRFG